MAFISTNHFPADERVMSWERYNRNHLVDVRCLLTNDSHFEAQQYNVRRQGIGLAQMHGTAHAVERSAGLLKRTPKPAKMLSLITHGAGYLHDAHGMVKMRAGDAITYDANSEFILGFHTPVSQMVIDFPVGPEAVTHETVTKFSGEDPLQRKLIEQIRRLAEKGLLNETRVQYRVDLELEKALHHLLVSEMHESVQVWFDACDFIGERLSDNRLTPAAVADHVGYSLRHLARIFSDHGMTIANYIREQRLDAAYEDLTRKRSTELSIADIAGKWGFETPVTFSRAFTRRFGQAPSSYRLRANVV